MSARGWNISLLVAATLWAGGGPARADDDALAAALRGVVEGNLDAYDREDVDATLATIHSRSPSYQPTSEALASQLPGLDLDAELVEFRYIGHDDEFAVARVKTRTTAESGQSDFVSNIVDSITIFHQENGSWKLWSEYILGVEVVPQ